MLRKLSQRNPATRERERREKIQPYEDNQDLLRSREDVFREKVYDDRKTFNLDINMSES